MHNYYHIVGLTDLQAMRDDAERRLKKGEPSVIHGHSHSDPCFSELPHWRYELKDEG